MQGQQHRSRARPGDDDVEIVKDEFFDESGVAIARVFDLPSPAKLRPAPVVGRQPVRQLLRKGPDTLISRMRELRMPRALEAHREKERQREEQDRLDRLALEAEAARRDAIAKAEAATARTPAVLHMVVAGGTSADRFVLDRSNQGKRTGGSTRAASAPAAKPANVWVANLELPVATPDLSTTSTTTMAMTSPSRARSPSPSPRMSSLQPAAVPLHVSVLGADGIDAQAPGRTAFAVGARRPPSPPPSPPGERRSPSVPVPLRVERVPMWLRSMPGVDESGLAERWRAWEAERHRMTVEQETFAAFLRSLVVPPAEPTAASASRARPTIISLEPPRHAWNLHPTLLDHLLLPLLGGGDGGGGGGDGGEGGGGGGDGGEGGGGGGDGGKDNDPALSLSFSDRPITPSSLSNHEILSMLRTSESNGSLPFPFLGSTPGERRLTATSSARGLPLVSISPGYGRRGSALSNGGTAGATHLIFGSQGDGLSPGRSHLTNRSGRRSSTASEMSNWDPSPQIADLLEITKRVPGDEQQDMATSKGRRARAFTSLLAVPSGQSPIRGQRRSSLLATAPSIPVIPEEDENDAIVEEEEEEEEEEEDGRADVRSAMKHRLSLSRERDMTLPPLPVIQRNKTPRAEQPVAARPAPASFAQWLSMQDDGAIDLTLAHAAGSSPSKSRFGRKVLPPVPVPFDAKLAWRKALTRIVTLNRFRTNTDVRSLLESLRMDLLERQRRRTQMRLERAEEERRAAAPEAQQQEQARAQQQRAALPTPVTPLVTEWVSPEEKAVIKARVEAILREVKGEVVDEDADLWEPSKQKVRQSHHHHHHHTGKHKR